MAKEVVGTGRLKEVNGRELTMIPNAIPLRFQSQGTRDLLRWTWDASQKQKFLNVKG